MNTTYSLLDKILATKYQNMLGFYNIKNISNNTVLLGNTTLQSNLISSSNTIIYSTYDINGNLYCSGKTMCQNNILNTNILNANLLDTNDITSNNVNINSITCANLLSNAVCNINTASINNTYINGEYDSNILKVQNIYSSNDKLVISAPNITIGNSNSEVNFNGTSLFIATKQVNVTDQLITINATQPSGAGIDILGISGNGFIKTSNDGKRYVIKAPLDDRTQYISTFDSNNNLTVTGFSVFRKNITASSMLYVLGDVYLQDNAIVTGNLYISNYSVFINDITMLGSINIFGDSIFNKNVTTLGTLVINGSSEFNDITINGPLQIAGDTQLLNNSIINSTLSLNGNSLFNTDVTITSNIQISSNTIINSIVDIKNDAKVNGNLKVQSNNFVLGSLNVKGNMLINNNITSMSTANIYGNTIINKGGIIGKSHTDIINIVGQISSPLLEFATNSLAAANGIPLWGFYRTGGIVKIRLDVIPPDITLIGYNITMPKNTIYIDPGVIVTDNLDENISAYVISIIKDTINYLSEPILITTNTMIPLFQTLNSGIYTITYKASDSAGNFSIANRIITIT